MTALCYRVIYYPQTQVSVVVPGLCRTPRLTAAITWGRSSRASHPGRTGLVDVTPTSRTCQKPRFCPLCSSYAPNDPNAAGEKPSTTSAPGRPAGGLSGLACALAMQLTGSLGAPWLPESARTSARAPTTPRPISSGSPADWSRANSRWSRPTTRSWCWKEARPGIAARSASRPPTETVLCWVYQATSDAYRYAFTESTGKGDTRFRLAGACVRERRQVPFETLPPNFSARSRRVPCRRRPSWFALVHSTAQCKRCSLC